MNMLWINEAAGFIGGCEQYIHNTVRLLQERGVRNTLLYDCNHPGFATDFVAPFDGAFPLVDIKTQVADIRPDLIYIHRLSGTNPIKELRKTGVPTVRFFHDTKPFCPREHRYTTFGHHTCHKKMGLRCYFPCLGVVNRHEGTLPLRLNFVHSLRRELAVNRGLDAFVVASNYMTDLLADHGLSREKTHVIPLYANPPAHEPPTTREAGLFLFVGTLIRSKGVDTLLHALARTGPSCRLVIIGQGRQETMFRKMAESLGLADRATFLGSLPHEEVGQWYAKANAVVLPVRQPESFALVGPEAMRYGTPVIATRIGGVDTWLEEKKTGLVVPPNDPQALAAAMDTLAAGNGLCKAMGETARERYNQLFRPERHVDALLGTFNALTQEKTG